MRKTKITVLSAFAIAIIGTASLATERGNPGNAKPVGNSPYDGITGNSGNNTYNRGTPGSGRAPMEDQQYDKYWQPGDYMGWELFGKRAIRQGDWTIVYLPQHELRDGVVPPVVTTDKWQLYNLANDPAEMTDLSASEPKKLAEMVTLWKDYAARNNVIIPDHTSGY